ncbi:MAG: ABC transporter permease [Alphaproteobacteria bacterium]
MSSFAVAGAMARRELRGGIKGFRTFLACLALGVAAIAGIGSLSSSVTTGLAADANALLGGDVDLRMMHRPVSAEQIAWLNANGTVSQVRDMRAMAHVVGGDARTLVSLKAVDGRYPLYGALQFDVADPASSVLGFSGGEWGAAVERSLLARLGVSKGDKVRVGEGIYRIRAVIVREPDRAGGVRSITLGPRLMVALASLPSTRLVRPGSLLHYHYKVKLPPGRALGDWKRALAARFPEAGWRLRDRANATPGLRRFIDRTAQFLTLVGLTALLVGGVGIGNSVGAYLAGKRSTIATLKCLGAPSRTIFQIYFIQVALMALGGIALGIAVGALIPALVAGSLADWLPVPARLAFYPIPLMLAAIFGMLTMFAFSLWPIARACQAPAGSLFRDLIQPARRRPGLIIITATATAIATLGLLAVFTAYDRFLALWFVGGSIVAIIIFRAAAWAVRRLARRYSTGRRAGLRLALANLHRPGSPTGSILLSLGLGLTVLMTVALIEGNLARQIRETMPARAPGIYFIDIQTSQIAGFEQTARSIAGFRSLKHVPMLRGRITDIAGIPVAKVKIAPDVAWVVNNDRGLTWSRTAPEGAKLVAGKWWPADYAGPPLISLDARTAEGFGIGIGDSLTLNILGRPITARIASLRRVEWGTLRMNFVIVFSPGVIEQAPQTHIATVHVTPEAEVALEKAVTERFANVTAIRVREVLKSVAGIMERVALAVRLTAAITIVAGMLVLGGAIAAGHRRRVYDAVVLKVLGATRRVVLRAFLTEFGLVALAATFIAAIIGTIAAWAVVTRVMHVDWVFLPQALMVTILASLALTLVFGFAGTWRALGQKAAPLLRNE